jgi:hypothetical protein
MAFFRDGNGTSLVDPSGLVPYFTSGTTFNATTGASTAEVGLSTGLTANVEPSTSNKVVVRLASGTAGLYYSFGAAGASGSFTAANMTYLPPNWIEFVTLDAGVAKSLYHLQSVGASIIQLTVLGRP